MSTKREPTEKPWKPTEIRDHALLDGWYFDDYDAGTWLVAIKGKVVRDGILSREEAVDVYMNWPYLDAPDVV